MLGYYKEEWFPYLNFTQEELYELLRIYVTNFEYLKTIIFKIYSKLDKVRKKRAVRGMAYFITSDHHFKHKNILNYENRPFNSVSEMDKAMIENWNKVVTNSDYVYHLGDFVFGNYEDWTDILSKLKGKIILVMGNHDSKKIVKKCLREGLLHGIHEVGCNIKINGVHLYLSHFPMEIGFRKNLFSIHGHIHSTPCVVSNQINVGVDSEFVKDKPFGQPLSLKELEKIIESKREEMRRIRYRATDVMEVINKEV